jgi:hypothetical protein
MEGRMAVTGKQGRRCQQLPDDLKEKMRYRKLKKAALDLTLEEAVDLS